MAPSALLWSDSVSGQFPSNPTGNMTNVKRQIDLERYEQKPAHVGTPIHQLLR